MMQQEQLETLLSLTKTILDEDRLRILGMLANEASRVEQLAARLDLKPSALSRHLARLQETGLVRVQAQDGVDLYALDIKALQAVKKELFAVGQVAEAAVDAQSDEEKILSAFVEGERLRHIPAKHSKRLVILRWLVGKFEPGVRYPEPVVNDMLKRHHPDCASLRRYLVDYGFMRRQGGIYWRTSSASTGASGNCSETSRVTGDLV